jgi:hypothetical protein
MTAFVKEWRPGSGAHCSHPHAAIISVLEPELFGVAAAAAAAQQSSRRSVSDFEYSNKLWQALQLRVLYLELRLLFSFQK